MKNARRRFALLSALTALVVSGFAATSSYATPEWVVKGASLGELGLKEETISGSGAKAFTLGYSGIHVKCETQSITGSIIEKSTGTATIKLTKCVTTDKNGKESASCKPTEPVTLTTKTSLSEIEKSVYLKFAANTGKPLGTIEFDELCPLTETSEVTGEMAGVITETEEKEKSILLTKNAIKVGENTATVEGEFKLSLSGGNVGQNFAQVNTATALCMVNEVPCEGNLWAANSAVESSVQAGAPAKLTLVGVLTSECSSSSLIGETTALRAQPLGVSISTLSFATCNNNCAVLASSAGPVAALRMIEGEAGNGRLSILTPKIKIRCVGPNRECAYKNNANVVVDVIGGAINAVIKAVNEPIAREATLEGTCPLTLEWTGTYTVTAVSPLFVTR